MKKLIIYLLRWQLSTIVLAPCIYYLSDYGSLTSAVVANFIGGLVFFKVDELIFNNNKQKEE